MTEQVVDEKSDDLDIVSIGKLYQGPWEKKYWSSSRGKDRHPYPVGYVAHRTCNGNTYKMAILEGLKGPEFAVTLQISSTDGESCSGQTPDIAWEGFQKKSCVRIKFWRGKRFSCKIDGAELFGFKNPLVARLLRGLKANASPIVEKSLPSSCFGNEQPEGTNEHHTQGTVHYAETCKDPDLQMNLVKTEGKEKRSKKRKEVHVKSVIGTQHKRERPQDLTQTGHENHNNRIPLHLSNSNENKPGLEKMDCNGDNKSHLLSTQDGLQLDSSISSENLEKEKCPAVLEAGNSIGSKDVISNKEGINLFKKQENLDVLISTCKWEPTSSKTTDEKGDPPVQKGSQMMDNVDLYAPDTLDPALDEKGDPPAKKDSQMLDDLDLHAPDTLDSALEVIPEETNCSINEKLNGGQILVSEKCVTESEAKDEMVIGTGIGSDNSYKSDSDSVGHEITNSMMTLLLPRALPLLKTYSRKKKKNLYKMSQEERKGTNQCPKDEPPAKSFEELQLENHQGVEDSTAIAPDSFENHQCEPMESSQARQFQDADRADESTSGVDLPCTHEGHHVCSNSEDTCHVEKTTRKTKSDEDVELVLEKSPQRGGRIMDTYDLGNISPSRKDPKLTDIKISPCHIEVSGTTTAVDAKSASQLSLISTQCEMTKVVDNEVEVKDESCLNKSHYDELQNVFEVVGCYMHPTPISMVMLRRKGNEVLICVLCGYLMEKERTLFVYTASIKGEKKGHPSFIGHTRIISPVSRNASGDQVMQFTPDGKCLVLLNNITSPYCREGGVKCQFSACTPDSFEKNAVKIVQVKLGYVHVVCKLKTSSSVCCILVCEPNYLLVAEETGRMNLWTMNSTWSAATEHGYLATSDCMSDSVVSMKKIPNFPGLVVGHTAFGDFCLWDVTRRILVSKFSAPGTSFLSFLPINTFRCPKSGCKKKQEETQTDDHDNEDLSLVLLVSSVSNQHLNDEKALKDCRCWSLALLAKNKLILLNALDPSTVAGVSAGYGIMCTCEGSLYIWELSSGAKLGYLTHCTGATVSCLVADDSGVFAVAVDGSQLQVYALGT
ncbi:uncharacterized protein LOC111915815 isoform X2 [Lactuca sativa]|uniref:uncharacterized protein LOC111915815 isoform X2 n=1 Tax=Lactuca sativa TaxID=4236 RepID=UPI0022AF1D50|nr:uncharacterized protein LOC111915815 isoform X2 [Lactuca sativa]